MTGSASQAMDVVLWFSEAFQRRGPGRRYTSRSRPARPWRIAPKSYIYIYTYKTQLFKISILERFWRGFWRGVGERLTGSALWVMDVVFRYGVDSEVRLGEE